MDIPANFSRDYTWRNSKHTHLIRSGVCARNAHFDNVVELEVGRHYNGSGSKGFGGAREWPHVRLDVSFQEGEEDKAEEFAQRLADLVNEFLPLEGGDRHNNTQNSPNTAGLAG